MIIRYLKEIPKNNLLYLVSSFFVGFFYCGALTATGPYLQNVVTIFFVLYLLFSIFFNFKYIIEPDKSAIWIFCQLILLNLGIGLASIYYHSPENFFWVQDSVLTHLPHSIKFSEFFNGNWTELSEYVKLGKFQGETTHATTGLFIKWLGQNTFSTLLAQLLFKLISALCIFQIAKLLWSKKIGAMAMQLYGLCPTIFFYNLTLYKEGAVQALYSLIILLSLMVLKKKTWCCLIPIALMYYLMRGERYYMSYIVSPMTIYCIFFGLFPKPRVRYSVAAILSIAILYLLSTFDISLIDKIKESYHSLLEHRRNYSSFSDVLNAYNYDIPYPVAFLKILFSPIFSFNKFSIFSGTSLLLIWGSFANQVIILSSIIGFYQQKKDRFKHIMLWLPFILFLLFAAYVSPWSGRLRDSFYPLVACYAAFFLSSDRVKKLLRLPVNDDSL